MRRKRVYRRRI